MRGLFLRHFQGQSLQGLLDYYLQAFILQPNGSRVHGRRVQGTPIAR
jgi:hypothetical protein